MRMNRTRFRVQLSIGFLLGFLFIWSELAGWNPWVGLTFVFLSIVNSLSAYVGVTYRGKTY